MRTTTFILTLLISGTLFSQTDRKARRNIDVYKTGDSIFNSLANNGIDTVLIYSLRRNSSETIISKDKSHDNISAYIFWQTRDSCFIKKINSSTIYQTISELRRTHTSDIAIATIFDYYKSKKAIIDKQEFRPTDDDLKTKYYDKIIGKDTLFFIKTFGCSDCNDSRIKYKIGKTFKDKQWTTLYFDRDNKFFNYNITSELYHLILITKEVMAHHDRQQSWETEK